MKKIAANLVGIVLALLSLSGQASTCTRADLTGTWHFGMVGDKGASESCKLIIPDTGNTISSNSTCRTHAGASVAEEKVAGELTIASDCRLTGTLTISTQRPKSYSIDARLNDSKNSLSGVRIFADAAGALLTSYPIIGIK